MNVGINQNIADEIKSRCNIVDVIGRVVVLKKAGSNYKGACPFHNEKTPSFVVSEQKQIYTCFGCGASGDVIEFMQRYYNLDFMQAAEKLAAEYGIKIESSFHKNDQKDKFYEINREAASFFFKTFLAGDNPGYEYMKKRGIEETNLKKFGIGYADGQWDSLYKHLTEKGYNRDTLTELGLISLSKGKYYDKFRDRVMFPIINTRGKVIGFGGRAIGDGIPKYLNSPETPIFQKKNNLYGLNLTRQDVGKEDSIVIVEGYMDVISLYQSGIKNVAASLGTALTESQAKLLKRYTGNVTLSYDSDEAGQAAALRGIEILHRESIKVKVLHVTDGKDPDEFVKKNGKNAFLKLIDSSLPYADYKIESIRRKINLETTDGRVDFIKAVTEILRNLSPIEADLYIKKIAREMKISEGALRLEVFGNNNSETMEKHSFVREEGQDQHRNAHGIPITILEKYMIKLILIDENYYHKVASYSYIFTSQSGNNIFIAIKDLHVEGEDIDIDTLIENLDVEDENVIRDIIERISLGGQEKQVFCDCVRKIEIMDLKKREKELLLMLSMVDEEENQEKIVEISEELMEIQKNINE